MQIFYKVLINFKKLFIYLFITVLSMSGTQLVGYINQGLVDP